jgi:hypothetical protein
MMDWDPNPGDPEIFHITHVRNLPGILEAGGLWSDAKRIELGLSVANIGHLHIKDRRLRHPIAVNGTDLGFVGQYVPFNFCPRSVMLFAVHCGHDAYREGQGNVVHLVSRLSRIRAAGLPYVFSDIHADLGWTQFFSDDRDLAQVPWNVMGRVYWSDETVKRQRQAEFLVREFCPFGVFERVGVHSKSAADQVYAHLGSKGDLPVEVLPGWYYPSR